MPTAHGPVKFSLERTHRLAVGRARRLFSGERWQITLSWRRTRCSAGNPDSVLRDDFGPESDVDVLVSFEPRVPHTLLDIVRMQEELSGILGREVDLIERTAVEQSRNYIRRKAILQSAETIHAG